MHPTRKPGFHRIAQATVITMVILRRDYKLTLSQIGNIVGYSSMTVYNKTKDVPHKNRRCGALVLDKRSGNLLMDILAKRK